MNDYKDKDDAFLMRLFRDTLDEKAFNELISRYAGKALSIAKRYLFDTGLSEDAVQETVIKVIKNSESFDYGKPFSCWFYAILRNSCLDMLRKNKRHNIILNMIDEPSESEPVEPDLNADIKLDILECLPVKEKEVLHLRIVSCLSFAEISNLLGCSEEAAKKRSQRGLRALKQIMSRNKSSGV